MEALISEPQAETLYPALLFNELGLTAEEDFIASSLLSSPDRTATRYRLITGYPNLKFYTQAGFLAIIDRASDKLRPFAGELDLPEDFRIYTIGGLGITILSETSRHNLSKQQLHDIYRQKFIDETKEQVFTDVIEQQEPADWETYSLNGNTFHIQGIGFSNQDGQMDKYVSYLRIADQNIYPAVLTSNRQYTALRTILANNGYIDPQLAANMGAPTNIKHIMRKLNAAYGLELFGNVANISRGYAVNADISAKNTHIASWLRENELNLTNLVLNMPDTTVFFRTAEPYTTTQKRGISNLESRHLKEISTTFAVIHIDSLIRYCKLEPTFEQHAGKPFLFMYKRMDYSGKEPKETEFTIELTESEAATLLLFKQKDIADIAHLTQRARMRARERFKSFVRRLERLGLKCEDWESTRMFLRFPGKITPV